MKEEQLVEKELDEDKIVSDGINVAENNEESAQENTVLNEIIQANNKLKNDLDEKNQKCDEYLGMLQRSAAEFDNYKKRTQKEKEAIYVDSTGDVVTVFLTILDNMERALAAISCDSEDVKILKDGVDMVYKQFQEAFKKLGVEEIATLDEKFNPQVHNAVMHVEDENFGENQVIEVFQKGYKLKDKVLRHSMVKVAN